MTSDPRGPMRKITNVEKFIPTETGQITRVTFECGCVGEFAPHRPDAYRIGDEARAFGCNHVREYRWEAVSTPCRRPNH